MKFTKESVRRALRTFAQAAIAYVLVNVTLIDFGSGKEIVKSALVGLTVSALAAGFAAVMNMEERQND